MSAAVVRLPTAAPKPVRNLAHPEARGAWIDLKDAQAVTFPIRRAPKKRSAKLLVSVEAFERAYREAVKFRRLLDEAKADYFEVWECAFADGTHTDPNWKKRTRASGAIAQFRIRLMKVAEMPAPTVSHARMKRDLIGEQYLTAEDEWFSHFRNFVAADAERLGVVL